MNPGGPAHNIQMAKPNRHAINTAAADNHHLILSRASRCTFICDIRCDFGVGVRWNNCRTPILKLHNH